MKKWLVGLTILCVLDVAPASKDSATGAGDTASGVRRRSPVLGASAAEEMPTPVPAVPQIDPLMPAEFRPYEWRVLREKYLAQGEDVKRKFRLLIVKGCFGEQDEYNPSRRADNVRLYASLPAVDWFRYVRRHDPERTNSCLDTVPCFCCLGVTAVMVLGNILFVAEKLGHITGWSGGALAPDNGTCCPPCPPPPGCPPSPSPF